MNPHPGFALSQDRTEEINPHPGFAILLPLPQEKGL